MSAVLYIAARAPRPGFAKTRLGHAIGHERAALLYAAFIRDLAARFARVPFAVGWYITPEDAWDDLAPLVHPGTAAPADSCGPVPTQIGNDADLRPGPAASLVRPGPVLVQGPGDWSTRQQALFRGAPERGETQTILVASDSPQLSVEVVAAAFALLERHDLVLGPVEDGGYYLVGMRGSWNVLGGMTMSTGTVLAEIVARAERLGLSVAFVPPTFDVDEPEDLGRLAELAARLDDVPATRAALDAIGRAAPNEQAIPTTMLPWPVPAGVPSRSGG